MNDVTQLTQLVLLERQGRDRGWWPQLAGAFAPDATVHLSWINGSAEQFVAGSKAMVASGTAATHRMAPPVVHMHVDRALVEASAVIEVRTSLDGVEVDLASRVRLLYRASRYDDGWLIDSLDCIYESDAITPTTPGLNPAIDVERMTRLRPSYRWLSYVLAASGHPVADDLPGEDRPDDVASLYAHHTAWLEQRSAA